MHCDIKSQSTSNELYFFSRSRNVMSLGSESAASQANKHNQFDIRLFFLLSLALSIYRPMCAVEIAAVERESKAMFYYFLSSVYISHTQRLSSFASFPPRPKTHTNSSSSGGGSSSSSKKECLV
jgi:hypothetical protein